MKSRNKQPKVAPETTRWERLYEQPEGPLMAWVKEQMTRQGMDMLGLAAVLGVTPFYLHQLSTGERDVGLISDPFAGALATFLNVPMLVVLVVSGRLRLIDCVCADSVDRWAEGFVSLPSTQPMLRDGGTLGPEDLWLIPVLVAAVRGACQFHEARLRVTSARG